MTRRTKAQWQSIVEQHAQSTLSTTGGLPLADSTSGRKFLWKSETRACAMAKLPNTL